MLVGVISDTHGLLRPEAVTALQKVELILHAGDIGRAEILDQLAAIAPVCAIRGNIDRSSPLPATRFVECESARLYLLHDRQQLSFDPAAQNVMAVISGHSHQPRIDWHNGVLYLNPGSAGPRRFRLPVTLAHLHIEGGQLTPALVSLL